MPEPTTSAGRRGSLSEVRGCGDNCRRVSGSFCFSPPALWAQLASQTALVGTVTDSGGLGRTRGAGRRRQRRHRGYLRGDDELGGVLPHPVRRARPLRDHGHACPASGPSRPPASKSPPTRWCARTPRCRSARITDAVTVEAKAQVLDTDRATGFGDDRRARDRRAAAERAQRLEPGGHDARRPGRLNSDIGLSFRGAGQREIQNSLSLDGINSSANLLAATSMRPIADAVTEIQVQTGSTSAEYGSYLGVHINVVTKSGTNDLHGSVFHFQQDDSLDSRGYFDNPGRPEESAEQQAVRRRAGRPRRDPRPLQRPQQDVLHGRLRRRARRGDHRARSPPSPRPSCGRATSPRSAPRSATPRTGQPFPGNIIPPSMTLAGVARAPPVLSGGEPGGHGQQLPGSQHELTTTSTRSWSASTRTIGNKARLSLRYNWHDSYSVNPLNALIPVVGGDPAAHQQELAVRLHPHAPAEPPTTTSGSATTTSTSTR